MNLYIYELNQVVSESARYPAQTNEYYFEEGTPGVNTGLCGQQLEMPVLVRVTSKTHLEILALLSTIDSHTTNIARIALDWNQKAT